MSKDKIIVKGAREHNLKNIDVEIPRDKLVVITGLSGSGKSSLAFDTIYAEGQRRYVESLSSYARQFLGQMDKPDVDYIEGLSPAISIDQKTTSRNPRSTVGTVTEIYDYLRLLFARIGEPHCPKCGRLIAQQTVDQMVDILLSYGEGTRLQILAPLVRGRKGEHLKIFEDARKAGYVRVRVDGEIHDLQDRFHLEKNKKHTIEIIVDRIILKPEIEKRLADSLELALGMGNGIVAVDIVGGEEMIFSQNFACVDCGISLEEITPRMFSFNNPYGACPACDGLGYTMKIDPELIIANKNLSISEGAVARWSSNSQGWYYRFIEALAKHMNFSLDVPIKELPPEALDAVLYGTRGEKIRVEYDHPERGRNVYRVAWEGIINNFERRYKETNSEYIREEISRYMSVKPCSDCQGARLRPESLSVLVGGKNIYDISTFSIREARDFFSSLKLTDRQQMIGKQILKEISERLSFLDNVGLDYLTLHRPAGTLSGGEAQRIRLATQIGSSLMGVLYILDEPSIGLHQRDNTRLIETLKKLRDLGNTVLVVEHDEETMVESDYIIDIGPGAGEHGGRVVAAGTLEEVKDNEKSITGQYLSGRKSIPLPDRRRQPNGKWLEVLGAAEHNLKKIDVGIPLGTFTCVTGVSGSGKSTLVNEIIFPALAQKLNRARIMPGYHQEIKGIEHLEKVINI
ncbi:MAG: excinuclease ABC subunit UvrA, partial [Bacillota bacterium]